MKSFRFLDRRAGYSLASLGLLLGLIVPSAFPAFAAASGQLDSRSISMSSSAADAAGVTYELKATTESSISATGGLIIEFCSDSPLISLSCTHPSGLNISTVAADSGTATDFGDGSHAVIKWVSGSSIASSSNLDIKFSNIHNPTAVGSFYARVTTYDTAFSYVSATNVGTTADQGAVALSTTDALGVTAYVRESMTFCVSAATPTASCAGATNPSLTLGEDIGGGTKALASNALSTGQDIAQLSTNASGGAVVNLQSDATGCGGLYLNGNKTKCHIAPQATSSSTFAAGTPDFGLTVGSATNATGGTNVGTLAATNGYDGTNYFIDYQSGDTAGVTSTYGSAVFNSAGAPVSNKNIPITFGASISDSTPAGIYGATLSMIATGTF